MSRTYIIYDTQIFVVVDPRLKNIRQQVLHIMKTQPELRLKEIIRIKEDLSE